MAVPGSIVGVGKLITPGGQQGPKGDAGTAANVPLADITQNGLLRQNTGLTTDFVDGTNNCQPILPVIWNQRLRSYNAIGNPNFEVDQRNVNVGVYFGTGNQALFSQDRWYETKVAATMAVSATAYPTSSIVPGTSFCISQIAHVISMSTQQATMAAGECCYFQQTIEGPQWRELTYDVHSVSILCITNVSGGLKFALSLRDPSASRSLVKLCTIPVPNVWTLITLPNLPVFPSAGNFSATPGSAGYVLGICYACGSTYIAPAANVWQNGNFVGAPGMDNLGSKAVNSQLQVAFVQHEPGPLCTTLQDKPFSQNLDECMRYYCKSASYEGLPGSPDNGYAVGIHPGSVAGPFGVFVGHPFPKPMAKAPVITAYHPSTGAINSCGYSLGDGSVGTLPVTSTGGNTRIIGFINSSGSGPGPVMLNFGYAADTGW